MIAKVNKYLGDHDTSGLNIQIMSPELANCASHACEPSRAKIRISVTGNVLRDD